jgi:hypothetical protein
LNESAQLLLQATRTFSSTVRCGKVAEIWNERITPRRAICAGFSLRDVLAVEQDLAARGHQEFGQQVEAGGLAGAVGADQRVDGADVLGKPTNTTRLGTLKRAR